MTASTDIRGNLANERSPKNKNDLSTHLSKKRLNEKLTEQIKILELQIKQKYRRREKLEKIVEQKRADLLKEQENTMKI